MLGHPLGSTGARLMTTLVHEMRRREARYGMVRDVYRCRPGDCDYCRTRHRELSYSSCVVESKLDELRFKKALSMKVNIRYFAIVREALGRSEESRELPESTAASDLLDSLIAEAPRIGGMRRSLMLMVNQEYVDADYVLQDGDEFVLVPPVSGGEIKEAGRLFRVTTEPLDPRETEAVVTSPDTGAVVTFTGAVRDHARGQSVTALDYEAYAPAAEKMLARIGNEIRERWGLERIAIVHRTGLLTVGEASVVISISSAHRDAAFDACRYAIERLKEIVPIWKKEFYQDGETWVEAKPTTRSNGPQSLNLQCAIGRCQ